MHAKTQSATPTATSTVRHPTSAWRLGGAAVVGLAAGVAAALLQPSGWRLHDVVLWGWCGFALTTLAIAWRVAYHAGLTAQGVQREDPSSPVLLVLVLLGCAASLTAVGSMLVDLKNLPESTRLRSALLAAATVGLSWLLIHTRYAFHYAHRYIEAGGAGDEQVLDFPGEQAPDYGDFLYFSFVIGMTSQVSDVTVHTRAMRRLVLMHSLLSFAFNMLILALGVNALASAL
jgi:uncharacterized membrane protein